VAGSKFVDKKMAGQQGKRLPEIRFVGGEVKG
jgi:hypothetical protein